MYNLRYHIASLVGVFLALALGLVLGGLVVQRGTLDRQQEALIKGLRTEFSRLTAENKELRAENLLMTRYASAATSAWMKGRLDGRTVLVVSNGGRADGQADAVQAIEAAGGTAALVTVLKPNLGIDDPAVSAIVTGIAGNQDEKVRSLASSLAAEWAQPLAQRPLTDALVKARVLSVDGLQPGVAGVGMVDVALDGEKPDAAALAAARAFAESGRPALGAQTRASEAGVAAAAVDAGLGATDIVDTDAGRYTVVALLNGARKGHYGTGEGASALFPPFVAP